MTDYIQGEQYWPAAFWVRTFVYWPRWLVNLLIGDSGLGGMTTGDGEIAGVTTGDGGRGGLLTVGDHSYHVSIGDAAAFNLETS